MAKPVLVIDGRNATTLEGFYDEIEKHLTESWGRNLDAFNDILRGGFGTPDGGFVLRWEHANVSRATLGHDETVRYLEEKSRRCHPSNVTYVTAELEAARRREGPTLFDILLEIIGINGTGGDEARDGVELELM